MLEKWYVLYVENIVHNNNAIFESEQVSEKDQWREYRTEKYTQDVIFTDLIVFNKCLTMTFQLVQWT